MSEEKYSCTLWKGSRRTTSYLILSDQANLLLKYSTTFDFLDAFALPGDNQEGIAMDEAGHLYIAQDSGGIIKLIWLRMEVDRSRMK